MILVRGREEAEGMANMLRTREQGGERWSKQKQTDRMKRTGRREKFYRRTYDRRESVSLLFRKEDFNRPREYHCHIEKRKKAGRRPIEI